MTAYYQTMVQISESQGVSLPQVKKSAVRYEVGLNIKTGDICWYNGGYPPGLGNGDMMFKDALVDELEEGERVETNMGYKASTPKYVKCPGTIWNDKETTKFRTESVLNRKQ